jgi:predicted nucleic acid-binding protein
LREEAKIRCAEILEPHKELGVDRRIAECAGRLLRTTGLKPPYALIAASAQEHGLAVVTRNVRHFEAVRGLRVRSAL